MIKKFVDLPKLVLRMWIILWISLGILLVLKYVFHMSFPLYTTNQWFLRFFNFLDNHYWFRTILYWNIYIINATLIFLIYTGKKYLKWYYHLGYAIWMLTTVVAKTYSNIIGIAVEIIVIIVAILLNCIKNKPFKPKILNIFFPIITYVILNVWQLNIFLVRGASIETLQNLSAAYSLLLQIDYYILLILFYIGVCHMGILGFGWLWNKELTELKALRDAEEAKENPDFDLIEELDRAIEKKEKEA